MHAAVPNLKTAVDASRIKSISYCHDTFKVTTFDGKTRDFWERNLRFKTDSARKVRKKMHPQLSTPE